MINELIAFVVNINPTAYELYVERKGEAMKSKKWSMFVRVVIALTSAWVSAVFQNKILWIDLIGAGALSFGIFFLTFNYSYNIIFHRKTRIWYSYLSNSPLDKLWGRVNWWLRMAIQATVFIFSLFIYIL